MILQCRVCRGLFNQELMETDALCVQCWAIEELKKEGGENHKKGKPTKQGDKGLPLPGERVKTSNGRSGQLELSL